MTSAPRVVICRHHHRELDVVRRGGTLGKLEIIEVPSRCGLPPLSEDELEPLLEVLADDVICALGGPCLQSAGVLLDDHGIDVAGHCLENFVDATVLSGWVAEGAYLVSPGWLAEWRTQIERWGFDQPTARSFFAESMSSVFLIDTGTDSDAPRNLDEFAAFIGLEARRAEVGLGHFERELAHRITRWRARQDHEQVERSLDRASRETSTYALAFSQLGELAGVATEREAVLRVFDLFDMLCGAQRMLWLPIAGERRGPPLVRPAAAQIDERVGLDEPGGLRLEIARDREPLGILEVGGLPHPERRDEYLNLALALSGVIGLAIANARSWEALTEARAQLAAQSDAFRALANSADGLVVFDRSRKVEFINPAARRLLGVGTGEVLHLDLANGAVSAQDPSGRSRVIDSRLVQMPWQGREATLATVRDITDQQAAEEAVQRSQKMTLLGELAGSVAHDFNNVLQAIAGGLELAGQPDATVEDVRSRVRDAAAAADRGTAIARRLLRFSRPDAAPDETVDLSAEVQRMTPLLRQLSADSAELAISCDDGPHPVIVGEGQLEAVLLNLVTNARDSLASGGRIQVSVGGLVGERGAGVVLSVEDDGEGIDAELLDRIFEPFFTTKAVDRGTGLGLPTVRTAVEQMGGELTVESSVGVGTRFDVWLPHASATTSASVAPLTASERGQLRGRVLVVDDEAPIRSVLTAALSRAGAQVGAAASGEEALALLSSSDYEVDLLMTDLTMPGMDGFELAVQARAARPDLRVMFMSGMREVSLEAIGIEPARVWVLAKPFRLAAAVEQVGAALDET